MTETCRVVCQLVREFALTPVRPGRHRWSATVAAVVLSAISFGTVAAAAHSSAVAVLPAIGIVPTNPPTAASPPAYSFSISAPTGAPVVNARAIQRDTRFILAPDVAAENGLQVKTILAARAISAKFPQIHSIGGVRPDGLRWHPDGLALDVMITDYHSPAGIALGDRIVEFVCANADQLALDHLIWRQTLYLPNGTVRRMGDRGSDDANHLTHVHIATHGGGFPSGRETYFTSMGGGPAISSR